MFEKLKRFADKWASGGFDVEEPSNLVVKPWRVFGTLVATLFIIWLVWFGLAKYFYAQDTKEFDIPNPIKAVPADSEYYAQKRKVKPGLWILTTEVVLNRLKHPLVDWTPLTWTIKDQYPQKLYEKLFYKPKPFIDGGWFQNSIYSSALEGLKYCRINFKPDSYSGMVGERRMSFVFTEQERPCILTNEYRSGWSSPALIFSKDKNIFYLDFWGYLQSHVNNYDDIKDYIYRCEETPVSSVNCKLLGYDQDAETLKERSGKEAQKSGTLVPLRLWN